MANQVQSGGLPASFPAKFRGNNGELSGRALSIARRLGDANFRSD